MTADITRATSDHCNRIISSNSSIISVRVGEGTIMTHNVNLVEVPKEKGKEKYKTKYKGPAVRGTTFGCQQHAYSYTHGMAS